MNLTRYVNIALALTAIAIVVSGGVLAYRYFLAEPQNEALELKLDIWKQAVSENPKDAGAHANLGALYRDMGKNDKSIEELQKAVDLAPDANTYVYELGLSYRQAGKPDSAIANFLRALELFPPGEKYSVHYQLAETYFDQGDMDAAGEQAQLAIADNDVTWNSHYLLGRIYQQQGDTARARKEYETALKFAPGNPELEMSLESLE